MGYLGVRPEASVEELQGRFLAGSGISGGNLRRSCVEHSWENQQEVFARFLLVNLIALYESWISEVLEELNITESKVGKELQFPTKRDPIASSGIWWAISRATIDESKMLRDSVYNSLLGHRKNSIARLDNLLKCFRYFKECRNSIIHRGGIANQVAEDAYSEFVLVANRGDLGLSEVPAHAPVSVGAPIHLFLRGVVGFGDVILRMVATVDAELSRSQSAEDVFRRKWVAVNGNRYTLKTSDAAMRERQIGRLVGKLDLPRPATTHEIEKYLRKEQLVG